MRVALSVVAGLSLTFAAVGCGPESSKDGCKDTMISGDLVITEVFADFAPPEGGTGTDEGKEWFEIYNASDRPIELEGLTLVHSRPDGMKPDSHEMGKVTIAPGQFLTLGNSVSDLLPPYVDYGYSADLGGLFNTDGGKLALTCGTTEIDSAIYDAVRSGHSRQLSASAPPDYTFNDDQNNWCEGKDTEFESSNFGTPGEDNDCAPIVVGQCNDGGTMRPAVAPGEGDLVITEVMPGPNAASDTTAEWFEVKVFADVDLNGVGLDRVGDSSAADVIASPDCIHVTTGSYVIFAKSTDMTANGGLPAGSVLATFKFSMVAGTVAAPGDVQLIAGTTVIDAITWTKSTSGKSVALDPDLTDAIANDSPSNFCDGTAPYGLGDLGTPGAENGQCNLLPPAGMCSDNGTNRPIVKPAPGALVITEFLANPAGTAAGVDAAQEWFEIANTGATAFDLNDLGTKGNAATVSLIQSADCKSVPAAGFALFAHNTDAANNGGLPVVDATFSFSLAQSAGSISVLDGMTPLDTITWTTGILDGTSKQLQPLMTNVTDNDVPANFCNATATQTYGATANLGTPKALNVCL